MKKRLKANRLNIGLCILLLVAIHSLMNQISGKSTDFACDPVRYPYINMRQKDQPSEPVDQYRKTIGEHANRVATKLEKHEDRDRKISKGELQEGSQVLFGLLAMVLFCIFLIFLYVFSS